MRRSLIVALAILPASGCAITDRLDLANGHLATVNSQLTLANQQLAGALQRLDETNRRMDVIDQAILKFPGLRADPVPNAIPAPAAPAAPPG